MVVVGDALVTSVNLSVVAAVVVVLIVFLLVTRTSTFPATTSAFGGRSARVSAGVSATNIARPGIGIMVRGTRVVIVITAIVVVVIVCIACATGT